MTREQVMQSQAGHPLGQALLARRASSGLSKVRSVERAAAILQAFKPHRPRLGLSAVAAEVGLDKGTTRRLLHTLMESGMVAYDGTAKTYALGLSVLELAAAVPQARSLREAAAPLLAELAAATGQTVFLSTARDGRALCLQRASGAPQIEIRWWQVGETIPLNCGGGPRVLLAHLPDEAFEAVLATGIEARTERSETEPDALRQARARIRAQDHEVAVDDCVVGLSGVGVPIRGMGGAVVAALSISGLTPAILGHDEPPCLPALKAAAEHLGEIARATGAA